MKEKGFTMVELMVSISIIAVVMVFLVRLLVDIKYDSTNELYNTANQINRAEIIKTIQEDLKGKNISNISDNGSGASNLNIVLTTDKGTAIIIVDSNNNFKYKSTGGKTTKWKLKSNNKETYIQKTNIPYKIIKGEDTKNQNGSILTGADKQDYVLIIDIPVIIDNSELRTNNDSKMDNIILTFYGYGNNSIENNGFLNQA